LRYDEQTAAWLPFAKRQKKNFLKLFSKKIRSSKFNVFNLNGFYIFLSIFFFDFSFFRSYFYLICQFQYFLYLYFTFSKKPFRNIDSASVLQGAEIKGTMTKH